MHLAGNCRYMAIAVAFVMMMPQMVSAETADNSLNMVAQDNQSSASVTQPLNSSSQPSGSASTLPLQKEKPIEAYPPLEPEGGAQYDYSEFPRPPRFPNYGVPEYGAPSPYRFGSPMYEQPSSSNPLYEQPPYGSQGYQTAPPYPVYGMLGGNFESQVNMEYAPAGLMIPISLRTAISTQVAKEGDYIEAKVTQNVPLSGINYIPAGAIVSGEIKEARAGRRLSRSGSLTIDFNQLRLPRTGEQIPIAAHLVGIIGRYKQGEGGEMRGEGWKAKVGQLLLRGGAGAGLGAALGTGLGAIAGGGYGVGQGAWAGAAIGGGLGGLDMLLRKGRDVIIPSGTEMKLQLDEPLNIPSPIQPRQWQQPSYPPQQQNYGAM